MKTAYLLILHVIFIFGCRDGSSGESSGTRETAAGTEKPAPGEKPATHAEGGTRATPAQKPDAATSNRLKKVAEDLRFSMAGYLPDLLKDVFSEEDIKKITDHLTPKPLVIPVATPQGWVVAVLLQDTSETELTVIHRPGDPPKPLFKVERMKREKAQVLLRSLDASLNLDDLLRENSPLLPYREESIPSVPINEISDVLQVLKPQTSVILEDFERMYLGIKEENPKNVSARRSLIYFVKPILGSDGAVQGVLFMAGPVVTLKDLDKAKPYLYYVYRKPDDKPGDPLRYSVNNAMTYSGKVKVEDLELGLPSYRGLKISGPGVATEYTSGLSLVDLEETIAIFNSRLIRITTSMICPEVLPNFTTRFKTRLLLLTKPGEVTYVVPFRYEEQTDYSDAKTSVRCKLEPSHLYELTADGQQSRDATKHVLSILREDFPDQAKLLKAVDSESLEECEKLRPSAATSTPGGTRTR